MSEDPLARLRIASSRKRRASGSLGWILAAVLVITGIALYLAYPRTGDGTRAGLKSSREAARAKDQDAERSRGPSGATPGKPVNNSATSPNRTETDATALVATGYIIARERIELSPRFLGVVTWIGVKKGDAVTNGQVVVRLDDSEYRARLAEVEAQMAVSQVAVDRANTDLKRAQDLVNNRVEMQKMLDDARLALAAAEAQRQVSRSARQLIDTYRDWCIIRSPVNGVVLERLVDANELVTPQTFGSGRGPSTSLIAVADLTDLQVETDVSEADLGKVRLGQRCLVSPEAYPDKEYAGVVAEIAPEANRAKGTLSVKVKIENPDRYLTPELSAKVRFLSAK